MDLDEASDRVLTSDELDELVVDPGAVLLEESTARRERVPEVQVLPCADAPVVPLLSLLLQVDVLVELLLAGEGDPVDPLQGVVFGFAQPVGRGVVGHCEGLNFARVQDVRSCA